MSDARAVSSLAKRGGRCLAEWAGHRGCVPEICGGVTGVKFDSSPNPKWWVTEVYRGVAYTYDAARWYEEP